MAESALPDVFLERAGSLLDWHLLTPWIDAVESRLGAPVSIGQYKLLLLERWFQLSSPELADACLARAAFRRFLGAPLHGPVIEVALHRDLAPRLAAAAPEVGKLIAAAELLLRDRGLALPQCAWTGREPTIAGPIEEAIKTRIAAPAASARAPILRESTPADDEAPRPRGDQAVAAPVHFTPTLRWPWGLVAPVDRLVRVGRDPEFSLVARHVWADLHVSRRHAELEPCAGAVIVRDLRSTNFTFVDEVALAPGSELRVERDARLRFGPQLCAELRFRPA